MTLFSFPEFILPGKSFQIKNTGKSAASINLVDRVLSLPLDDIPNAIQVNRHELAHAKWSPTTHPKQSDPVFQACEDGRMNLALQRLGVPYQPKFRIKPPTNPKDQLLMAIAVLGTNFEGTVNPPGYLMYIVDTIKALFIESAEYSKTPQAQIEDTEAACEYIYEQLSEAKEKAKETKTKQIEKIKSAGFSLTSAGKIKRPKKGQKPKPIEGTGSAPEASTDEFDEQLKILLDAVDEEFDKPLSTPDISPPSVTKPKPTTRYGIKETGDPLLDSGKMSIVTHKMPREGCKYRKNTYTSEGSVLTAPHRMPIDGAIFKRRKRHFLEGTVLIDVSSSMRLTAEQVEEIILASSGHTTVAIYSGDVYEGKLQIVAARGKMVSEMPYRSGGNVVDYPALLWLGKQPGKKFWVCDGYVTGCFDIQHPHITEGCARLEKKHNIKRFPKMADFMQFAKRLR